MTSVRFYPLSILVLTVLVLGTSLLPDQALANRREPVRALPEQGSCAAPYANEIVGENCLPGNPPGEWDITGGGDPTIQGFTTDISAAQGGTVTFKVDTPSTNYRLDIYRMGYYGGLGARKIATVEPTVTLPQTQPACLADAGTGLIDCGNWAVSASWVVPTDAVSGIYFAKLVREDSGGASHVFFIVRDDDGASDILYQASDTTWQAYNEYGGNSLYVGAAATPPTNRAYKVSYNRPFNTRSVANGQDWVFNAEYPMVRWLERNGYDVSYFTGVDSDRFGSELLEHKLFLSVGHDEYWSAAQRANVEAARAAGKHLAFFSGNQIFWKTRWEPSIDGSSTPYRTLVSYKETHAGAKIDPEPVWTGTWRDVRPFNPEGPRPENALSGQIFMVNSGSAPLQVPYAEGRMRMWRNTAAAALSPGSPPLESSANVIGYEWDESLDNSARPPGLFHLSNRTVTGVEYLQDNGSTYAIGTALHRLSLYRHSSGALVFGAGTIQWSWGLDSNHDNGSAPADAFIQQATVNLFADMGVQPATLQAELIPATASTDTIAPVSTILTPVEGATVQAGLVTVNGTATDVGGVVGGVEVSVDGGLTWRAASGRESWSYTWTPTVPGSVALKSRAVDDSGNLETPGAGIQVTIAPRTCPCSIWEGTGTPAVPDANDNQPIEVGVKFRTEVDGYITGLRFYKGSQDTGTHVGHLWDSAGNQLAAVTFLGETASGWQQVALDQPVAITAGTPYVASYHSSGGGYAYTDEGLDIAVVNAPLRALANGEDEPNGVYKYGASGFPTSTYNGSNYWVDVIFATTVGPDTTPPEVVALAPAASASGVSPAASISADFSEPLAAASVSGATFELRDSSSALVPAAVTYLAPQRRMQLKPDSALAHSTTYTARIVGGSSGVTDVAGNALAADRTWSFTTAAPPPPPPDEGPGGPILVIASTANPFSRYYAEILRAEGLNSFVVRDISLIDAAFLGGYQVAILGEMALSDTQVAMLTDWVEAGGNLIAMRPAAGLAPLLGLDAASGTLADGYFLVDTRAAPGAGIVGQTMQFHGDASLYTLNGATAVAMLYSNATTATGSPAVTQRSVGSAGGQAASFAFDLARSVVLTRQGNPAWQGQNRDGQDGPTRSDDMFYGNYSLDPQPDWVNLDKVAIPQADEAQRLLANLITGMAADRLPLPRFWYFPRGEKAVVVMTHDDHGSGDIVGRLNSYNAASPTGCSVDDWECVRSTTYAYVSSQISDAQIAGFKAQGHEVVIHVSTGCADFTPQSLRNDYNGDLTAFAAAFPSAGPPLTQRTHCIAFSDWDSQPTVELENGIRLDVNYYFWPPAWVQDRPGLFTGSGMPMRFARADGAMIDVYQATTQMTDESGQSYPHTIDTLLDRALGPEGYYGAFVGNLHADGGANAANAAAATVASAKARGVPIISAGQLLTWLDGRNGSSFANISYAGDTLTFDVRVGAGANGLTALLPAASSAKTLQALSRAGSAVPFTVSTIKGVAYAQFEAAPGAYSATFGDDTTAPTVVAVTPADAATGVAVGTAVDVQFSEPMNPATLTGGGFELRDPSSALVAATVAYNGVTATLTPGVPLAPGTQYTARILTSATDAAGNALTTLYAWSFTTAAGAACPCSIWPASATPATPVVADDGAIELGVKFRSSTAGYITGIRFHRGDTTVAGPFAATLWSSTGTRLATATLGSVTTAGWQEVLFANPVAIAANTTYVASYFVPAYARYPATPAYFATSGTTNLPLTALQSGVDGPNGVYKYGTASSFPTDSFNNTNYWVDVVFDTAPPADTTPPTILQRTPAPGAIAVSIGAHVTVQFSEPMDAATIGASTLEVREPSNIPVTAAVAYNAATNTATVTPGALLAPNTQYVVTVRGGASGVKDAAGNPLVADAIWSFTTGSDNCPCSLWDNTFTPASAGVTDNQPIEVGTKYRSSGAGRITAVRFYKGAGDTDTHVGHLWTADGTQLAAVTFTGETTSGWQQVELPTPVSIQPDTTYIVSIFSSPKGYFAITPGGLATARDNPPLRAPASGEDGPNGVYKYGGGFPDGGNNANYWVDVVFAYPDSTPPAISARTPAPGATGVAPGVDVTVQFNEPMNATTINATTVRLRASGAGSDVAAAITYDAGTRTATLNPDGDLALDTDYEVTVAGSVADAANNPLGADVTWTFRTMPAPPLFDDTVADFAGGTPGTCYLAQTADGEIILSPMVGTEFSGTTQPDGWGAVPWTGGGAAYNGSAAAVDGARLATDASFTPGHSLEFVATFGAATYQNVGFGQSLANTSGEYWAMFGTWSAANTLYARTNVNGSIADIALAGNWIGSAHRFRIDWSAGAVVFSIDGSVVHTQNITMEAPMRPVISDYQSGGPAVMVEWLRMTPYAASCIFISRVLDRGSAADWLTLTSSGERPPGTTATFETRSGDSALPDASWSGWQGVGAGNVIGSPDSRYIQYRVALATSNAAGTPVVADVSITSGAVLGVRIEGATRYWYANEPVAGATLSLTGGTGRSATSAPDGSYAFAGVPRGAWTLSASKSDEVRGVTANDAALVLQHTVGSITLTGPAALAADVTKAGGISSLDASSILQVSVGAAALPAPWSFLPPAIAYPALAGDQLGQDFTAVILGDVTGNWGATAPAGAAMGIAAATPAAILWVEARPVADGTHDWVFKLEYSGEPIYSVDLVLSYDLTQLEVLSAEVPPRPGQLSAINLADPGVVRIGVADSIALPQDALVATVRVRSTGDPLAALTSVNAAADEQPIEAEILGQEFHRLYLPIIAWR